MRGFVAPTDFGWYQFLRQRPEIREVNFWRPSQSRFAAIQSGELFFFKLKAPHNAIGGFGIFTRAEVLPIWEAWDVFGAANGVPEVAGLIERLGRLSGGQQGMVLDDWIGCLAINEPVFFPPDEWVEVPSDWQRQIVSGKGYDLTHEPGRSLYESCIERAKQLAIGAKQPPAIVAERYGPEQLVRPRLGQSSFRLAVREAYGRRCAVTGEHSLPVIEAAHIRPYRAGGEHAVSNGLFLRRDVHRLYDLGYVTVRPDHRFAVSRALRDGWANGRVYYELDGREVGVSEDPRDQPQAELLEWHSEEIFRG